MKHIILILFSQLIVSSGFSQLNKIVPVKKVNDSLTIVTVDKKFGVVKHNDNFLIEPVYNLINYNKGSEYLLVLSDSSNQLYDIELNKLHRYNVARIQYHYLVKRFTKYIRVYNDLTGTTSLKVGFMNHNGELVIPIEYEDASGFYNEIVALKKDGKYGLRNSKNEEIAPFQYESISSFSHGYAQVRNHKGKYGFINTEGNVKIPEMYKSVSDFYYGKAIVSTSKGFGIIDTTNTFLVKPKYDSIMLTSKSGPKSKFKVTDRGKWGVINSSGKLIVPIEFEEKMGMFLGIVRVRKGGKEGMFDSEGNVIVPMEYDRLRVWDSKYLKVEKDGKIGVFDHSGKVLIPVEYDDFIRESRTRFRMIKDGVETLYDL